MLYALFISTLRMRRAHQIHDLLGTNEGRRKDVDQLTRVSPGNGVLERFGMNIRSHLGGDFVGKGNVPLLKDGMHPANAVAMCTFQMTHSRILARANHPDHGLVVVIEDEVGASCCQRVTAGSPRRDIAKSAVTISASGVE